MNFEITEV